MKRNGVEHLFLKGVTAVFAVIVLCLSYSATCAAEEYTRIQIFPEHVGVFTTVGQQQFVAFGYTSSETAVNITEQVNWESSNKDIATIDETGLATVVAGKTAGQVKITCSYPKSGKGTLVPVSLLLLKNFDVTPSVAGGHGTISPATVQTVHNNATTQFTLTPEVGYHSESVAGTCGGTLVGDTYTTDPITKDCTVIASFAIDTHSVTPSVDGANGTIAPTEVQTVNYNATTQFTLSPAPGYHGVVAGTCGGTLVDNTYTTNPITADCTVIASFAIDTFTLTYGVGTCESITGDTPQTVNYGADGAAVTAVAPGGSHFVEWSDASTDNPRTDTSVTADISVTATCVLLD